MKKLDFKEEISQLCTKHNAVILAHYYQDAEIQDIADHLGDSLALAQAAKNTDADVIVFCGVHFMAETAKILNPERTVLLPDLDAGCSLADSCPAPELASWKLANPKHEVVSYINCSAAVKALSDVICTSSNARKVVESIPADKPIMFCPDQNLGSWVQTKLKRPMDLWPGACHVHEAFRVEKIQDLKLEYPNALFICHPECEAAVRFHADFIGSTSALLNFVEQNLANEFIVGTEVGILHQMKKVAPNKLIISAPGLEEGCNCSICPYMKLNTLEKIYLCLRDGTPEITIEPTLQQQALKPLERMLAL